MLLMPASLTKPGNCLKTWTGGTRSHQTANVAGNLEHATLGSVRTCNIDLSESR